MLQYADLITAVAGASAVAGSGIVWLWRKVEKNTRVAKALIDKRLKEIDDKLKDCEERERVGQERGYKQLTIIEMLYQEVKRVTIGKVSPVMSRVNLLLKELRETDNDPR